MGKVDFRRTVDFMLCCLVAELLVAAVPFWFFDHAPVPLDPWRGLLVTGVAGLVPGWIVGRVASVRAGHGDGSNGASLVRRGAFIVGFGGLIGGLAVGVFYLSYYGVGFTDGRTVTVTWLTLAIGQLVHMFNMRSSGAGRLQNELTASAAVWVALVGGVGLCVAAVTVLPLARAFGFAAPGFVGWGLAGTVGALPFVVGLVRP